MYKKFKEKEEEEEEEEEENDRTKAFFLCACHELKITSLNPKKMLLRLACCE